MSENHYAEFSECSMKPQEVLEYVSGPIPVPEEGEVLVRMKAAPINPADINFVQGVYGLKPVLPHSRAGLEGCGVVQESRAEGFREGDEVILLRGVGSWSEYVAVPSVNVMKLPVGVDPVQAAMLKVNPLTALRMLEGFVSLEPGDWLVQNAANSGVGRCIIQLAREMGVKTVNFVRRPDELRDELTELGADLVVGEDDGDVVKNTLARLDGKRPVLASNAVGGESALRLMDILAPGGSMVTYGAMSRKSIKVPNGFLIFKGIKLEGLWVTQWLKNAPVSEIEAAYDKLARLMADGRLKQAVDTVYPLSADLVVGEDDGDVVKNTLARLDGKRPVLASNAVGGESALRLMDILAPGGSMVTYGAMSRKSIKVPNGFLIFKGIKLEGLWVTQWLKNAPVSEIEAAYDKLARLMADGRLKQAVDTVYPLSDVRKAVEKAQEEFRSGKVVLSMDCA